MSDFRHETVLLGDAVDALITEKSGIYCDGTFGRGGHAREILSRLTPQGRLIATDKDPEAIKAGLALQQKDARFEIVQTSFSAIGSLAPATGFDGVLLDLGVSSPQLDDASRGFSFMRDGPLDMRMDNSQGQSAADWLNSAEEADIANVLWRYGEEKKSRFIARKIIERRAISPLETTKDLANLIESALPRKGRNKHPATRTFQAVRVHVNQELEDLERFLDTVIAQVKVGGRLVIIGFHSLEDRKVKQFFKAELGAQVPSEIPLVGEGLGGRLKLVGKPVKASDKEDNVRARSAIMRVAERVR